MAEQIVVAVDGSDASTVAIEQAVALARQRQMALAGIFVIDGGWPDYVGNDWQSAKGARQGFLDYIREEQEAQAEAAREQFRKAAETLPQAQFQVMAGDPTDVLASIANGPDTAMLVASKRVFQVSGRPSLKALAKTLAQRATRPLLLVP
jgi:nucleotide-binding universal stress UspA family protein